MDDAVIQANELGIGDAVAFGRPCSTKDAAVGVIDKVNRMTYQIRLTEEWKQMKRTYPKGGKFRVSKAMVWRVIE